jgi:hypothetical protein
MKHYLHREAPVAMAGLIGGFLAGAAGGA